VPVVLKPVPYKPTIGMAAASDATAKANTTNFIIFI
jgi:hypothetical protein